MFLVKITGQPKHDLFITLTKWFLCLKLTTGDWVRMKICLVASGFMCSHLCVCVCALALFHISWSANTVKCDSTSFLTISSFIILSVHSGLQWGSLGDTEWTWVNTDKCSWLQKCRWHTPPYSKLTQTEAHLFTLSCTQTQTNTRLQTVVLIKALSVSREICNPDI